MLPKRKRESKYMEGGFVHAEERFQPDATDFGRLFRLEAKRRENPDRNGKKGTLPGRSPEVKILPSSPKCFGMSRAFTQAEKVSFRQKGRTAPGEP